MPDEDPERSSPLDYAGPDVKNPRRDPMSYYREPPEIAEWTPVLFVVAVLFALVIVAGVGLLLVRILK
jgi:hypothetical protein